VIDGGIYVRSREDVKRFGRGLFELNITEFAKKNLKITSIFLVIKTFLLSFREHTVHAQHLIGRIAIPAAML
jgi:hypothetical protein